VARDRPPHRSGRSAALLVGVVGIVVALGLLVVPQVAEAASPSSATTDHVQVATSPASLKSSSLCGKVSAAAVSAIVGYPTPAQALGSATTHVPATKQSHGISGVETDCVYGKGTKSVILGYFVTSKPLTLSLLESETKSSLSGTGAKVKFTSYPGLGAQGFLVTQGGTGGFEEIGGLTGNKAFIATTTFKGAVSLSKLASLARLAKKL
jgi:hypothetical protein